VAYILAEDKIPVLTEVYKPKAGVKAKSTEAAASNGKS